MISNRVFHSSSQRQGIKSLNARSAVQGRIYQGGFGWRIDFRRSPNGLSKQPRTNVRK
ncbi:hypothetical protein OAR29_05715 [Rhodospirillales bacterium]|nr:hypothetical protein [Rhodospirillales bacterium]